MKTQNPATSGSAVGAVVLLVLPKLVSVLETVEAARTPVRPLVPVLAAVRDEVGALAERSSTYVTHVRLLPWSTNAPTKTTITTITVNTGAGVSFVVLLK